VKGSGRPKNRRDSKKAVTITAEARPDGLKNYVATVWWQDTGHRYLKWSITLEEQPNIQAACLAAFAALGLDPDHVAGIEITEVL